MNATNMDYNVKRCRWLKFGFVCAIIVKQIVSISRCVVLYVRHDELPIALFISFISFFIGTIFALIQLSCVPQEYQYDLKWFRTLYISMFAVYASYFVFYLYPIIWILIAHYRRDGLHSHNFTGGYFFDLSEPVVCLIIQGSMFVLLFRPYVACRNINTTTTDQRTVYSVSQNQMLFTESDPTQCIAGNVIQRRNTSQYCKKILMSFSICFYCMYVCAFVVLVYHMTDKNQYYR